MHGHVMANQGRMRDMYIKAAAAGIVINQHAGVSAAGRFAQQQCGAPSRSRPLRGAVPAGVNTGAARVLLRQLRHIAGAPAAAATNTQGWRLCGRRRALRRGRGPAPASWLR